MSDLVLLCDRDHHRAHKAGVKTALTNDHTFLVWNHHGTLLNTPALREPSENRKTEGPDPAATIDSSDRLHGTGEPMNRWALDTFVHAWLTHTQAA